MPTNRKEHQVYTVMMVSFMAFCMSFYNIAQHNGFTINTLKLVWLGFPLTFLIAFFCEWVIVGLYFDKLIAKIIKPEDPVIMKILLIPLAIAPTMAALMSFYGALLGGGFGSNLHVVWFEIFCKNIVVAYPLVILGNMFIGFIFRKTFPLGTIVEKD